MKALVEPYTAIPITQKVKLPSDSCILLDSATHVIAASRVLFITWVEIGVGVCRVLHLRQRQRGWADGGGGGRP